MRHKYNNIFRDEAGNIIASGTVSIKLAGTNTAANVYETETGAVAVNAVTTAVDGTYTFYVDRFDYDMKQQFKLVCSKTGYTSKTYDYVDITDMVVKTYSITADKTITTSLTVPKGVVYQIATGITLTINGPFEAGDYQVFSCVGTGKVVFGGKLSSPLRSVWWGDTGDGTTNDYPSLVSAFTTLAATTGGKLIISDGNHLLSSSGLNWTGNYTEVECRGWLLSDFTGAGTVINVGTTGVQKSGLKGNLNVKDNKATDWTVARIGIDVDCVNRANITVSVGGDGSTGNGGFAVGLKVQGGSDLISGGDSTAYSRFTLDNMQDNKKQVLVTQSGDGWSNENRFYGGRFWGGAYATANPKESGSAYIWNEKASGSTYGANNSRFHDPSFEGSTYEYFFYTNCQNVGLYQPRMEGSPTFKIFVDTDGDDFTYAPGYSGQLWDPTEGFVSLANYGPHFIGRYQTTIGNRKIRTHSSSPSTNYTYLQGDIAHHYDADYGEWALKICTASGTFSATGDVTGDTDGSNPTITGISSTTGFYVGQYVSTSAGFLESLDNTVTYAPQRIIALTSTSITLDSDSDSAESGITISLVDPVFADVGLALTRDTYQSVGYAATVDIDLSLGDVVSIAGISGDIQLNNPTNKKVGQRFFVNLSNGAAPRNITYDTHYSAGTTTISANKKIVLEFVVLTSTVIRQVNTPIELP